MVTFIDSATWNSSPLWSNLLRLQCKSCTIPTTSARPHGSPLEWACQWPSSQPLSSPQLSHNDSLWAEGITKSPRQQGLGYREGEELSRCPSWLNSLWQGWSCGLVYCPGENATDLIWRELASSNGISSWTPLKPQHSNPNPNPNSGVLTSLLLPHLSSSPTDSLLSLNLLCHSKTHARFMQDGRKAVWSTPHTSVAWFFPSLKQNFIAYHSSKVSSRSDCIFEIHQLWQSGFSRVYSNCCCSCSFEIEIIKTGQLSHNMYSNNILNFQESTTILNACTKKSGNLLNALCMYTYWEKGSGKRGRRIHTHTHTHTHAHTHTHTYLSTYQSIYIYIYIYIEREREKEGEVDCETNKQIHLDIDTYLYIYIYIFVNIWCCSIRAVCH